MSCFLLLMQQLTHHARYNASKIKNVKTDLYKQESTWALPELTLIKEFCQDVSRLLTHTNISSLLSQCNFICGKFDLTVSFPWILPPTNPWSRRRNLPLWWIHLGSHEVRMTHSNVILKVVARIIAIIFSVNLLVWWV